MLNDQKRKDQDVLAKKEALNKNFLLKFFEESEKTLK
jgi:hypothetical protein